MEEENKFKEDKLKKNAEGVNYYSGDKIEDLVPDAVPDEVKGDTQDDSNYIDEMYSDKQLERHKDMDNIFKVDGVPSRWQHNKSRSTWHFDPFKDPYSEQTFIVPVRFTNDFTEVCKHGDNDGVPMSIGNYRRRNESKQDKDLHDAEMMDIKRATGGQKDDVVAMHKVPILRKSDIETNSNNKDVYNVLHRIQDWLEMDVHMSRLHVQYLGQVTQAHIDQQMRYARPDRRKQWTDAGADTNPLKLRRLLIHLQDWEIGHVWQFGNTYHQGYKSGECVTYDWCNMPHGTANFGFAPRVTFQITGFVGDKLQGLIDDALDGRPTVEVEV